VKPHNDGFSNGSLHALAVNCSTREPVDRASFGWN
jgi:hypothetical protein